MQVELKGNWKDFFNSGLPDHIEAVGTIHTPSRDGALVRKLWADEVDILLPYLEDQVRHAATYH